MKKLAVEEIYPKNEIAKNMVHNKMKSHYRRVYSAKAKVDTNLPKPPKHTVPLSREICDIVDRNYYCYKHLPKHRRCLLELEHSGFQFKPLILDTNTESKLKSLSVYHPPVRTPRRTKSSQEENGEENVEKEQTELGNENIAETDDSKGPEEQRTVIEKIPPVVKKEMYVQTEKLSKHRSKKHSTYRPRSSRSLQFLKDITDDVLRKGVYTDDSLERIFDYHVTVNKHNLDMSTMLSETDRLREEVGMPPRPGLRLSSHSDEEALEALDSLQLDPLIKQDIIASLRLGSKENYHSTVIETPTNSSFTELSSQKRSNTPEIVQPLSEKECPHSIEQQQHSAKIMMSDKNELEMASTTSEVSDIQEIEFEDVKQFINEEINESIDDNSGSESEKSIIKSTNKVEFQQELIENNKSNGFASDETNLRENASEIIEQIIESEINDSPNENEVKNNRESTNTDTDSIDVIEEDLKSRTDNTSDRLSLKTEKNTEFINATIIEEDEPSESESDEEEENNKSEDNSRASNERSRSNNSSEMSSIHTETSESN